MKLGIHPDAVSYGSVVAAACAALCFWQSSKYPWLLLAGPLFCYIRLWLNMLDGMVAIASGKASVRGEILNDLPDRVSDVMIFAGMAHSGLGCPFAGYWAAILALVTAYVGMFGQAAGVRREFGGVMSKPWRMVALHIGAWLTYFHAGPTANPPVLASLTIIDLTHAAVIAGCLQTIAVRLRNILRALEEKEKGA